MLFLHFFGGKDPTNPHINKGAATHREGLMENYSFCVWATGGITGRALLSLSVFKCIILAGKIFTLNYRQH